MLSADHPTRRQEVAVPFTIPRLGTALVALAATAAIAGCGDDKGSSSTTSTESSGVDATAAAGVPAAIKSKGTLVVAADATYAPNEFIAPDGRTVQGMDPDLAKALAAVLGLKAQVKNATFDAIIPGLAGHKYDLGISSFTDTKEREKTVDFVTYFSAGTSFYVKADGGPAIAKLADLCGQTVAVERGTTQQDDAAAQAKRCAAAGKAKATVQTFPDQTGANLALTSGRAQVGMADSPVAAYQVKQSHGQFKLSGTPYGTAPYGIAIPKGSGLSQPILDALKVLIRRGTYTSILRKWGVEGGAITNPAINAATS
jgi:polar amino acid transport system substrate-binding protein